MNKNIVTQSFQITRLSIKGGETDDLKKLKIGTEFTVKDTSLDVDEFILRDGLTYEVFASDGDNIQNYKFVDKSMIESLIKIKQNLYSNDNISNNNKKFTESYEMDNRKSSSINKTNIKTICNKKLDELINILDDIKNKIEKFKKDNESETNNSLNCIIKNQQFLTDIMDKMDIKQDKSRKVLLYNKQKLFIVYEYFK